MNSRDSNKSSPSSPSESEAVFCDVEVPPELAGLRVDQAAAQLLSDHSRAQLSRWIRAGELTVDGEVVAAKTRVKGGERLVVSAEREVRERWHAPQAAPLDILFEDDDLVVLNKAAGMVVHPGAGNADGTLVNALIAHRPSLAELPRAGIVHRLDKDTSGVMVVAASGVAHLRLVEALSERRVHRQYVAMAEGVMTGGAEIKAPIGRHPHQRTRQAVREDGRPAYTSVRVAARYPAHTQIVAQLHTGRTHQIRVHLAHIGHPLVGDRQYGAKGRLPPGVSPAEESEIRNFARQALHAFELAFEHPRLGEVLAFTAPWPDDLVALERALGGK